MSKIRFFRKLNIDKSLVPKKNVEIVKFEIWIREKGVLN